MNEFNFCPLCGSKKISFAQNKKWVCTDCGLVLYCNVAAAVGLVICDADGSVLFETRAREPRKGFLALPGGFCNPDESAEDAARRECFEETGLRVKSLEYIAAFPNTYEYKNFVYKTCDIFFEAKIDLPSGGKIENALHADKGEVCAMSAKKIEAKSDIDALPLAFNSARLALSAWLFKKNI